MSAAQLRVLAAGPLTLIEDRGRPGLAHLGVGSSGAFDRAAAALGNRLVGNAPRAAVLEVLLGGLRLAFDVDAWVAVTGAWGSVVTDSTVVEPHTPTLITAGSLLELASAEHGIRYYLAVRGGIAAAETLGSRSRDVLAALGPEPLAVGDCLVVGSETVGPVPAVDVVPVDPPPVGPVSLAIRPGPRQSWFTEGSWRLLLESAWTTSARSDRTGIRLEGAELVRTDHSELPSEGTMPGAIQVSPDGVPTILGIDAPVTGGYPVIAVVTDQSFDALAQLRPGQGIRFTLATGR